MEFSNEKLAGLYAQIDRLLDQIINTGYDIELPPVVRATSGTTTKNGRPKTTLTLDVRFTFTKDAEEESGVKQ